MSQKLLQFLAPDNMETSPLASLPSDTVECYNLKKNEWTLVTNMMEPHYGHAGAVHGDLMYISGELTQWHKFLAL